jgi:hypothetical protein
MIFPEAIGGLVVHSRVAEAVGETMYTGGGPRDDLAYRARERRFDALRAKSRT